MLSEMISPNVKSYTFSPNFPHRCIKTYFHVVRHQDLAGFLDHWLRLELLLAEGALPGVEAWVHVGGGQTI